MNVEKQGRQECMLATLSALAGRPLAEVREFAMTCLRREPGWAHAESWGELFDQRNTAYWPVIKTTALKFGGAVLYDLVAPDNSNPLAILQGYGSEQSPSTVALSNPNRRRRLPAKGRGIIRVRGETSTHIMAWENGLIYDSSNCHGRPMTLAAYKNEFAVKVMTIRKEVTR